MEIEGAGLAHRAHIGFVRKLIALAAVAGMTARDEVLPGREASAGTGNDVVECEFA